MSTFLSVLPLKILKYPMNNTFQTLEKVEANVLLLNLKNNAVEKGELSEAN